MRAFSLFRFIFVTPLLIGLLPGLAIGQIGPPGGGALTITTSPILPPATPGAPYSVTLTASGGVAPYQWVAFSLPPDLVLFASSGLLSGTPSTANQYSFTIQVSDSSSPPLTAQQTFSLTVGNLPLVCSVSTSNTPILRSESLTGLVSDIVIFCTGGASAANGQPAPQVNITVALPVAVTSRLLKGNVSEALLLIDEPNLGLPAPVPGFGPEEPFKLCATPLTGCPAWAQQVTGTDGQPYEVAVNAANASAMPRNAAPNVYQGVVSGNQVMFFGVPVLAPGNTAARVLRITNVRLDASQVGGASPSGSLPVQSAIVTSDPKDLPLSNPTPILAFTQASLTTSVTTAQTATPTQPAACAAQPLQQVAVLTYKEPFASAFKTRVDPGVLARISHR